MAKLKNIFVNASVMTVGLFLAFGGAEFGVRTFAHEKVLTYFDEQTRRELGSPVKQKAPGEYRIFIFGESAAYGFPVTDRYSIAAWLKKSFEFLLPDRKVYVINSAWPGKASHHLLEGARLVLKYRPDLFIIYAGNNETGISNRLYADNGLYRLNLHLYYRSDFYRWLSKRIEKLRKHLVYGHSGYPERQYREEVIAKKVYKKVEVTQEDYQFILQRYRKNMESVVKLAKRHHVDVLFVNLPSNLRDTAPNLSLHTPGLADNKLFEWGRYFSGGKELEGKKEYRKATEAYRQAELIDPAYAELQYRLGKCYEQVGNYTAAKRAYFQARDLDALPTRAKSSLNEEIRKIVTEEDQIFVDIVGAFERVSPHEIVSSDLIFDDVHPSISGQQLITEEILHALAQRDKIAKKEAWQWHSLETAREHQASEAWKVDTTVNAYRYILQGIISWEQKRYVEAVPELEKGLELMPNFIESYAFLGDSYLHLGKAGKARLAFQVLRDKNQSVFETLLKKYPDIQQGYAQSLDNVER